MYAAGNAGYGLGAKALACTTTNSAGHFSFSAGSPACASLLPTAAVCPSGNPQVYYVATGGIASTSATCAAMPKNTAIGLIAALGPCGTLPSPVTIDEVTTAASVWALNQFSDSTGQIIGTSVGNALGRNNAGVTAIKNLVNLTTGVAPGPSAPPAAEIPTAKINTLADILAPCVQSTASTSTACTSLFSDATPSGGSVPVTTLQAAVDIARHPGHNTAALFGLATANKPFGPSLSSAPADWTLVTAFAGGGLSGANPSQTGSMGCEFSVESTGVAVDGAGNVWLSFGQNGVKNGGLAKFSPTGAPLSPSTGFLPAAGLAFPNGIAIDRSSNLWLVNGSPSGPNSVLKIPLANPTCASSPACTTFTSPLDFPTDVAIGTSGAWVTNFDSPVPMPGEQGSMTLFPSGGNFVASGTFGPLIPAVDGGGNVWFTNSGCHTSSSCSPTANIVELSSLGGAISPAGGFTNADMSGPLGGPAGIALDPSNNVWLANTGGSVEELDSKGAEVRLVTSEGVTDPEEIAVDGSGNVWVGDNCGSRSCSSGFGSVEEYNSSGQALLSGGIVDPKIVSPECGIAIDPSGNVWVADDGSCSVVEIIGAAGPVKTPLFELPARP